MFLSNIKLWNFRKFGSDTQFDIEKPNLSLPLKKALNVLIGENDSGKTAIIDAMKLVLGTHSFERTWLIREDFYNDTKRLRIELDFEFSGAAEAKNFTEWIAWTGDGESARPFLRLNYDVKRNDERIFPSDVRAGADTEGSAMSAEAKEYLKVTYLKPLRDAVAELVPKRNSRLAQILQGHEAFRGREKDHYLLRLFEEFNESVEKYFEGKGADDAPLTEDTKGKDLKGEVDQYIKEFSGGDKSSAFTPAPGSLKSILEKLELSIAGEINPGLGALNRLFMASELVHLNKKDWTGLRLALIEELEAHLHPQAQMQIIESLQRKAGIQILLTTHSPNLASKVKLDELIICNSSWAFPMGKDSAGLPLTALDPLDHEFLEHFLDVTKSNLFFAKGVIIVEGWAEDIVLPALAKKMKKCGLIAKDLTEAGVSVINVGGMSFRRYSNIFVRKDGKEMDVPVAVVRDVDVAAFKRVRRVGEDGGIVKDGKGRTVYDYLPEEPEAVSMAIAAAIKKAAEDFNAQRVRVFVSPQWTLEYCLFKSSSLSEVFNTALASAHPNIESNDIERELAGKLISRSLEKTEIARQIAHNLEEDLKAPTPKISLSEKDESIKYLFDAIKHACGMSHLG